VAAQYGIDLVVRALGGAAINEMATGLKKVEGAAKAAQGGIEGAANNIQKFHGAVANTTSAINKHIAELQKLKGRLEIGSKEYQFISKEIEHYKKVLADADGTTNKAAGAVDGLGSKFASLAAQLGLTVSAIALVKSSLDAAFGRDVAETRLRNLTGSAQEYELSLKMAAVASQRFGITQTEATKALGDVYGRLQGVGYGLKEINQIYTGFNVIAKQSGMAAEEASGAFFQLSQALGKGKLNGDEFVIIAERMPQLLDAIALAADADRSALTQMAQEGKITGDVLYKALAGSVEGANNLNGALTKQQTTMADVARYADEMRVQLGAALAPAFLAIMQQMGAAALLLSKGFQAVATWAKQNETAIVAIVNGLLKLGAGVAIVFTVVKAFQALQKAIAAAAAAKAFLIGLTGKGMFLVGAAAIAAAGAYKVLSDTIDGVGQEVGKLQKEASAEMAGMTAEIEKQQDAYSSLPQPIKDAKEAAKELRVEQEAVTKAIQDATAAAERQAQVQTSAVDGMLQVTQARLQAEQAVNQVLLDQAQRQLQAATSQQERVRAAQQIYQITARNAELELKATQAQIQAELQKSRIAVESARLKEREIYAIVQLAIAQKTVTKEHYAALNAQREAVGLAEKQFKVANQVAEAQDRAAKATYRGRVAAAEAAYEVNVAAKNTQAAAGAASQYANEMTRAAGATQQAASAAQQLASAAQAMGSQGAGVGNGVAAFGEAGSNRAFMGRFYEAMNQYNQKEGMRDANGKKYWEIFNSFLKEAEAYNKGKAAEANKSAMADWHKYTGGGSSKIETNVSITTGPVMRLDDKDYVSKDDMLGAVKSVASQASDMTLTRLQSDPRLRRSIGLQ